MTAGAVLEEVYSLPSAQAETTIIDRYGEACICEHGANMSRRVICPFQAVDIPGFVLWGYLSHEGLEVLPGSRVVVLADDKRSAGVRNVKETHTFLDIPGGNLTLHGVGNIH